MLRASIFMVAVGLCSAVDLPYSTIITSADVQVGVPQTLNNLAKDSVYRIYATFASGNTDAYAQNVKIFDSTGATFTVAGLSQAKPNSGYFLDNIRYLRAPIAVHDTNNAAGAVVPYTIYVVDQSVTPFPVVNAALVPANGEVDSNNGFIGAGITVLSAEQYFTMYIIDIGNLASMSISSVGYDEFSNAYTVMWLNSPNEARLSFLTVYGPVATLFNTNWGINARFKFQLSRNAKFDTTLAPGAAFALTSPGYLSTTQSYNIPYTINDALDRSYSFGANTIVQANYNVNDFQGGEQINLQFSTAENAISDVKLSSSGASGQVLWANRISLYVEHPNGNHMPRFLIQVTSGSSFTFSLLGVLLVSLFSKLY
ncbi:hypothetical protein PRIPAC_71034 [Pristionchus pacificus]|nr:hypothetical protein PRIPAC_71034 [Pristionchus pacificus]